MNDFLDRVFWDNTIRSYVIVSGVILVFLLLKRVLSRYFAGLIFRGVRKIWKDIDRKSFSDLVVQPLDFFLLIVVIIVSLYKLVFPKVLDVEIYKYTSREMVQTAATIILIISFIWLLLRTIDFIAMILGRKADLTPSQSDNQLIVFFKDFFKVVIVIIGLLMVLKLGFGFSINNMVTGLGIATAAIALSLRESLENLIASFIIFFDKPFTVGDLVKVQSVTGVVERIGLRSTKIRTDQKSFVTVPNKQMVDSILDNLSLRTQRKAEIRLELAPDTFPGTLEKFIESIVQLMEHPQVEEKIVFLEDIKSNAFLIHADYFTAPILGSEFNDLRQEINFKILRLMEELKIKLAGAGHDVRISGNVNL